jgi:hypothetical protein
MLIVLGTSLQVMPFASLISMVPDDAPRLLLNRDAVGTLPLGIPPKLAKMLKMEQGFQFHDEQYNYRDVAFLGDCDAGTQALARLLGWEGDLDAMVAAAAAGTLGTADTSAAPAPAPAANSALRSAFGALKGGAGAPASVSVSVSVPEITLDPEIDAAIGSSALRSAFAKISE